MNNKIFNSNGINEITESEINKIIPPYSIIRNQLRSVWSTPKYNTISWNDFLEISYTAIILNSTEINKDNNFN